MKLRTLVLGCLLLTCSVASASPTTIALDASRLGSVPRAAPAATQVARRAPRMPAALAGSSAEQEKMLRQMLDSFEQTAARHRLPPQDVAVAAAMLVAGAHAAYRGGDVSDAAFLALVGQMRDLLAASSVFTGASVGDRQDMYEMFAITGMVLAVSAKSKRGDASTKEMGRKSLAMMFSDPDAIRLSDRGLAAPTASRAPAPAAPTAPTAPTAPSAPSAPSAPVFASTKIVGIWWHTEAHYEAYPSNSMVMREDWHLLLADGTCTDNVPSSLAGWDPAALRRDKPKAWCTWRKSGAGYEVSWGKGWSPVRGTELRGFARNERIDGTWSRSKTGTVGTASTWVGTTLALRSNGRFELGRGTHHTSTTTPRPGEVVVSGTSSSDTSGMYTLDGYSLELRFDSGRVEHHLFAADSTRGTARFGGQITFKK